ncbi:SDR family oxidoreductase [Oscillatoria sp. CS-180]|uniref:SDR family NAD(P)-dependent oxidoreductase n=1 Tax=Oscillatoria sp. CS-180 TaxID=3021720 RepID=UPI00232FDB48|nr:SDR family oxidoreductase [Oscillatoria sp. CS-180]MDB9526850.1 SDR family oxidoreductase [Oscillatoria sp. CS-180]
MTTALVTGASSGIGAVFADKLAARGYDLVLVARSQDKLEAIAGSLNEQYGVKTTVIVQDLIAPEASETIFQKLDQQGIEIDVLINNAGFGSYGEFAESELNTALNMVQLNISALVELAYRCLKSMKARQSGSIVNISSTAAFQPIPYFAIYSASKAFVLSFSESLWYECKPYNIKVLGVCPGPTKTQFFKAADFPDSMEASVGQNYDTPEDVVESALKALDRGDSNVVTGGFNKILVNANRFLPRELLVNTVGRMFKAGQ